MLGYALIALVAAVVTAVLIPGCIAISGRFGFIAEPDSERRLHAIPTPELGGLAMCIGAVVALGVGRLLPQFSEVYSSSLEPWGVVIAALVITGVGLIDDRFELSPPAKIAGMALAGSALVLFGVVMYFFRLPFVGAVVLSPDLLPLLTVVWVIGMANAINLIDGLDGLAAGVVMISALALLVYSDQLFDAGLLGGENLGPVIAAATAGVCLGFLPYNWSPAKVFMGDSGAMLLGLLLAASTMLIGGRANPDAEVEFGRQTFFFLAPLLTPFLILAVPMADTLFAIIRRTVGRKGVAIADRQHLHHRLLQIGHGPRRAVVILWCLSAISSGFALVPLFVQSRLALVPLVVAFLLLGGLTFFHRDSREERRRRRRREDAELVEPSPSPSPVTGPVVSS
jgi:UDP-GlcNAc:undecaprenyl-phosphate/decaprenyl-phosphate GlcNAc-1-phosphate transferase